MTPTEQIDQLIAGLDDWRGETLARVRKAILAADPEIAEAWKWMGSPVWELAGNLVVGNAHKDKVKLTFSHGASLADPKGLFNNGFGGKVWRAIDLREGDSIDDRALTELVRAAIAFNRDRAEAKKTASGAAKSPAARPRTAAMAAGTETRKPAPTSGAKAPAKGKASAKSGGSSGKGDKGGGAGKARRPLEPNEDGVVLLSGGNPQIAKGDGDGPVQAYIAAMPGWKQDIGRRLDDLIVRAVPHVQKAVRWNSPFYGVEGMGWFLNVHCLTKYVKVTFFSGTSLEPIPPGGTPKSQESRWLDIYEDKGFDEDQMADWVKQAAAIKGWVIS